MDVNSHDTRVDFEHAQRLGLPRRSTVLDSSRHCARSSIRQPYAILLGQPAQTVHQRRRTCAFHRYSSCQLGNLGYRRLRPLQFHRSVRLNQLPVLCNQQLLFLLPRYAQRFEVLEYAPHRGAPPTGLYQVRQFLNHRHRLIWPDGRLCVSPQVFDWCPVRGERKLRF